MRPVATMRRSSSPVGSSEPGATMLLASFSVQHEHDVVSVRQCARQIAGLLSFPKQDQTRIATAVSEIARNAVQFASAGSVEFRIDQSTSKAMLTIVVADRGKGIASDIMRERLAENGLSRSPSGLAGAKRLM